MCFHQKLPGVQGWEVPFIQHFIQVALINKQHLMENVQNTMSMYKLGPLRNREHVFRTLNQFK